MNRRMEASDCAEAEGVVVREPCSTGVLTFDSTSSVFALLLPDGLAEPDLSDNAGDGPLSPPSVTPPMLPGVEVLFLLLFAAPVLTGATVDVEVLAEGA